MSDKIHRFIFDTYGIRGQLVNLTESARRMVQDHNYPILIENLLQQAAAVSALMATTLKFEGKISIQLQTPGILKMLVVQTTNKLGYRGLARYDKSADYSNANFTDLAKDGQMVITIEPKKGKRYQGIVPLEGNTLAKCVGDYFNQSEQLKTRIWLFNNESQTFGLMLQALPDMVSQDSFDHLVFLASTLTAQECLSIDGEIILHRLFHQESIRSLQTDNINFQCGCSEKKMRDSVNLLSSEEIAEILREKGLLSVRCEFCLNQFKFTQADFDVPINVPGNETQH